MPDLDAGSLVLVLAAASGGAILSRLNTRILLPTVVIEILLGILIGPEGLGWAEDRHPHRLSRQLRPRLPVLLRGDRAGGAPRRPSFAPARHGRLGDLDRDRHRHRLHPQRGGSPRGGLAARRGAQHDCARHPRPDPRRRTAAVDDARLGRPGLGRRRRVLADPRRVDLPHGRVRRAHRDAAAAPLRRDRAARGGGCAPRPPAAGRPRAAADRAHDEPGRRSAVRVHAGRPRLRLGRSGLRLRARGVRRRPRRRPGAELAGGRSRCGCASRASATASSSRSTSSSRG